MTEQINKHKNINEFRTFVLHNHYRFPKVCVSMLKGTQSQIEASTKTKSYENVLLESQLLTYYNRVYLSEQLLYPWMVVTAAFVARQIIKKQLNINKVINYCVAPGLVLSAGNLYFRKYGNSEREK